MSVMPMLSGLRPDAGAPFPSPPTLFKTFDWNPAIDGPGTLPGIATFTRSSDAYEFTGGVYVLRGSGVIRDQNEEQVGASPGYLPESAATNILTWSSEFSVASGWSFSNLTPTPNGVGSLGLLQTTLDAGTATGDHQMFILNASAVAGASYHIVKQGTGRYVTLRRGNDFNTDYACFDLQSGVVTEEGSGITSSNITLKADGWYKCEIDTADTNATVQVGLSNTGTPGSASPSFTGANETILICHAQSESTSFTTSPIVTPAGATVTRLSDSLDDGVNFTANWTLVVDATAPTVHAGDLTLVGGNSVSARPLQYTLAGNVQGVNPSPGTAFVTNPIASQLGLRTKWGMSYDFDINEAAGGITGDTISAAGAANQDWSVFDANIGSKDGTSQHWRGTVHRYTKYSGAQDAAELAGLLA